MLPHHDDVENMKQLILLSQDSRSAQQILLDLLLPCMKELESGNNYPQLIVKTLTIIQTYCEFDLPWQSQFDNCFDLAGIDGLKESFIANLNREAMYCSCSKQSLEQLIQWKNCRKNPLLPMKPDIVQAVYQLCHTVPLATPKYYFDDGRNSYCLYGRNDSWYWMDDKKQLTWLIT